MALFTFDCILSRFITPEKRQVAYNWASMIHIITTTINDARWGYGLLFIQLVCLIVTGGWVSISQKDQDGRWTLSGICVQHSRSLQHRAVDVGGCNGWEGSKWGKSAFFVLSAKSLEKCRKDLTSSVLDILCKYFGAVHIRAGGLNKFSLPVKQVAIERDHTKVVVFRQVVQDVD